MRKHLLFLPKVLCFSCFTCLHIAMNLSQIKATLDSAQKIALFGHEHIDGDALGAILGLGKLLEKQGKQVSYFTPNSPSRVFDFLELEEKLQCSFDYGDYDLLVFLDFNQYQRI